MKAKIIILDVLLNQMAKDKLPTGILEKLFDEFETLSQVSEKGIIELRKTLNSQNSKSFAGESKAIFKYRLTDKYRILFSYGRYFPYIRQTESDALVLISFADHDEQGFIAKHKLFFEKRYYKDIEEVLDTKKSVQLEGLDDEHFSEEDLKVLASIFTEGFADSNTFSVASEEIISKLPLNQLDKYLSPKQDEIIKTFCRAPKPTLVIGGAGTGKTLIAEDLLSKVSSDESQKCAYFTQSFELREKVKKDFARMTVESPRSNASFFDINEFCLSKLNRSEEGLIDQYQFSEHFLKNDSDVLRLCEKYHIDGMNLWTEIRGVIKGSMDLNWKRVQPISQNEIGKPTKILEQAGFLVRSKADKKQLYLADSVNILKRIHFQGNTEEQDALNKVYKHFMSFDETKYSLSKEEYMSLKGDKSTLLDEQRSVVWDVYCKYKDFLEKNGYYDDNDLARETIKYIKENDLFDFVAVDEVQDYTELQLYLINCLCKKNGGNCENQKILFVGDKNQNVNPTVFSESRLGVLYSSDEGKLFLQKYYLIKNFRCSKYVIDAANYFAEIRQKKIGKNDAESEEPCQSDRDGNPIFRLRYSKDNITAFLAELFERPGTVVIVPDETTKSELINTFGAESYSQNKYNKIFTVSEIKGMEYNYVLVYDLFGKYPQIWTSIATDNKKEVKHNTRLRYYFNLLNVAITRSQLTLGFVDTEYNQELESRLDIDFIEKYEIDDVYLSGMSIDSEKWLIEAENFEQNGKYKEAIAAYQRGGAEDLVICRCRAKSARKDRDYYSAVKYALLSDDSEKAVDYSRNIDADSDLYYLVSFLFDNAETAKVKHKNIIKIVEDNYSGFPKEQKERITKYVVSVIKAKIANNIDQIIDIGKELNGRNDQIC